MRKSNKSNIQQRDEDLNEYVPSDSEDDYSEDEKMLLEKARRGKREYDDNDEEEVFGVHSSDDEDDDDEDEERENMDSDLDNKEEDDLPNVKAWGKQRKTYYNTDYVDQDYGGFQGKDAEAAEYEEQEALAIQQRLAQQLDEGDFSLDIFTKTPAPKEEEEAKELIKVDLTKLSKRQKLTLLQKESPEFLDLVEDFKDKMSELINKLEPVLTLIKEGKISHSPACEFIKTKYHLILNYCTNIVFYLLLKARHVPVQSHPIVRRLFQYRQLLKQLQSVDDEVMKPQIDAILEIISEGQELQPTEAVQRPTTSQKKKKLLNLLSKRKLEETMEGSDSEDENPSVTNPTKRTRSTLKNSNQLATLENRNILHDASIENEDSPGSEDEHQPEKIPESKRAITYQIAKNKGLTPQRKKEQRNPRVKHRNKFRKAKIRRKGQVREARKELQKYGGEISGIKIGVSKSIKLK